MIKIRVPATSANLGPGFDCLGLALDIWNEVSFEPSNELTYQATGEGADKLNNRTDNLLTRSVARVYEVCGRTLTGVKIESHNGIFLGSGLGSSAAAIVGGIFGANEMLGNPMNVEELLKLAAQIEGHPDNVGAAVHGGLVVSIMDKGTILCRRIEVPQLTIVIVTPEVNLPTHVARATLPATVSRDDAIFNIGRTALVVDALRTGDVDLLKTAMEDRIHQPYRLNLIRGGIEAYQTAQEFGAAALSGAGPSMICFVKSGKEKAAMTSITAAFEEKGIPARAIMTMPSRIGVHRVD